MSDSTKPTNSVDAAKNDLSKFEGQSIHGESIEGGAHFAKVNTSHSVPEVSFAHVHTPHNFGADSLAGGDHVTPGEHHGGINANTDHVIGSAIPLPLPDTNAHDSLL